jgi:TolB-like protein
MGTVAYMSPEQARGKEVDARSDIFSLGILLYEMIAGRAPFAGESSTDVLAAIIDKEPLPLARFADDLPTELQRIVTKCLRKERDERYQTMRDVLLDLRELRDELALEAKLERSVRPATSNVENQQTLIAEGRKTREAAIQTVAASAQTKSSAEYIVGEVKQHKRGIVVASLIVLLAAIGLGYWYFLNRAASNKQIESIAVMPFVNESGNQDVEYLSDGMTETLIGSLSQLPNLNVKARSSVFRYKGKDTNAQTIGKDLNVQAILNGRVVQRGDQLTLSLELVDAETENVIWSEQYNRKQTDLVTLQSEIARDVSTKLKIRLSGADKQKLAKTYTTNAEAYRLYLQGRFYWNKRVESNFQKAIGYFNQAIALDPNYALAYAGLADTYALLSSFGYAPSAEGMTKARGFARNALSIDDSLAEPHTALGVILLSYEYDFAGAEREYKRAIELNPNYATAHQWYGEMLTCDGRFEEAFAEYRRGLEIDPLSLPLNWEYGRSFYYARKFDEAIAQHIKALELDAGFAIAHRTLSEVYRVKGDHAKAIEEQARSFELSGEPQNAALIRETFAKGGWKAYLRLVTAENSSLKYRNAIVAKAHLELGEKDEAIAKLNKAYENRESPMQWLKVEPQFDSLRSDPRFQELLKRVGFRQ